MQLAFHQPNFIPNISFFYKMARADVFVITTNVQFERREGWQRRHKIPAHNGDSWLSIPVYGSQNQLIRDVSISNITPWQRKHTRLLQLTYSHTKEKALLSHVLEIYRRPWDRLVDLNMAFITLFKETLHIFTPVTLDEAVSGKKQDLIVNICQKYQANTYLSGIGGKSYMTKEYLAALSHHNIQCKYINKNLNELYPYSALHFMLAHGIKYTRSLLI